MWHQVTADNALLLQQAHNVLAVHYWQWKNAAQLGEWIANRFLFYDDGPDYGWVLGFEQLPAKQEWRVVAEGFRGKFSTLAAKRPVEKLVEFLKSRGATVALLVERKRDSTDPTDHLYRTVIDEARKHPAIRAVTLQESQDESRWGFRLK